MINNKPYFIKSSKMHDTSQDGNVCVDAYFFGKSGGASTGSYSSLNCSKYVGDDVERVNKNLKNVSSILRADKLFSLHQTHGNACVVVDLDTDDTVDPEADAIVTKSFEVAITIVTADCAPLLFFDPVHHVIGAAHAGWKGAVGGVIDSTIQAMTDLGCEKNNILIAIGPCVMKNSYKVTNEFKDHFKPDDADCFESFDRNNLLFDLPAYCFKRLCASGINKNHIDILCEDTVSNTDKFFSYRFAIKHTRGICGRNISAICMHQT